MDYPAAIMGCGIGTTYFSVAVGLVLVAVGFLFSFVTPRFRR